MGRDRVVKTTRDRMPRKTFGRLSKITFGRAPTTNISTSVRQANEDRSDCEVNSELRATELDRGPQMGDRATI